MIKKFTLYLGLNDKDTKQQEVATIEAYKIVSNLISADFDGGGKWRLCYGLASF